ncbi:hypothetical protein H072_9220 [Dactylellina haptotyla CBS 200.50]|uniref:Mid2 domain-containing protein n=1 Tax=Dactylellina haptotyla (strain CBS 200.50) TaxID=1284197 RepID=S8A348_DACHA|nr:hypothetical protein H072_9220 [Dactylellina haptotyla CBS 200.50]
MSDTGATASSPTNPTSTEPTLPGTSTTPPAESSTSLPGESSTTSPTDLPPSTTPPPPETTTTPPETSTTEAPSSTTEPPSSTTEPPSSTEQSTTEPSSTSAPPVTVITVTPTDGGSDTTITLTTTSINTEQSSTSLPISSTKTSSSSTSSTVSATAIPSTGGGGLSQPAKIAIAIIIPIFAVVLIAFLGIFFWRRYKKRKDSEEMRRKEVEEYGYNPNNDLSGPGNAVMGVGAAASHGGDMAETDAGYRGWGNTAGGRKASAPLSTGATSNATGTGYGNTSYSDGGVNGRQQYIAPAPAQPELYGSPVAGGAVPVAGGLTAIGAAQSEEDPKPSQDRHSHSPLLSSPTQRPSTADSSTIGAPVPTGPSELDDGLHRGDSVASSRYTNATRHSEGSDGHVGGGSNAYMHPYTTEGNDYYNDVANPYGGEYDYPEHGPEQGYHQSPPMIQQVGARRNTRIENPPDHHYAQMPRQGNSGIAQNF